MVAYQEIQLTLKRIEEHLDEPLDIAALAEEAHLSPYYFQRLFARLVGRPIADYQRQRRLARAVEPLLNSDERILDIALKLGFQSHETFTRAFKEAFDMTPDELRKSGRKASGLTTILMPDVTMAYTLIDEGVPLVAEGIVLEITRRFYPQERIYAGFRVNCTNKAPNNLNPGVAWNYLDDKQMRTLPHIHPQGHNAGVCEGVEGGITYLAGCLVTERDTSFEQTRDWPGFGNLPDYLSHSYACAAPGEYLVCTYTAENFSKLVEEAQQQAINYFFATFIPKHKLSVDGPMIDIYDERCLRWHPYYRPEADVPHFEPIKPTLSQGEGPEMEIQIRLK